MLKFQTVRSVLVAILLSLVATLSLTTALKAQLVLGLERLVNPRIGDHFYTTNPQETYDAVRRAGYLHEGTLGSCTATREQGTTGLYRLIKVRGKRIHRLYTVDEKELVSAQRNDGYSLENSGRPICYVQSAYSAIRGRCQIYRLYNLGDDHHFYTTDKNEADNAVTRLGYRYEGSQGFLRSGRYNVSNNRCVVDKNDLIR